jgi:ribosomal-protein-alanine N-acetyltransferase
MQKLGMQYEGTLRQAGRCNAGICDEAVYSILREEYFGRQNRV